MWSGPTSAREGVGGAVALCPASDVRRCLAAAPESSADGPVVPFMLRLRLGGGVGVVPGLVMLVRSWGVGRGLVWVVVVSGGGAADEEAGAEVAEGVAGGG